MDLAGPGPTLQPGSQPPAGGPRAALSRVLAALLLGAALLLASTPPGVTQEESADAIPDRLSSAVADSPDGEFVPGRLLVKTTEDEDLEAVNRRLRARTEEELPDLDIEVIEFSPSRPVEDVAAAYEREPGVEYAEPYFVRRLAATRRNLTSPIPWRSGSPRS